MITLTNLAIQFGKRVLYKDVNIKFTRGNIYGVIGANGAGKSTLLRAISGDLEPNKGTVEMGPGERLSVLEQDHFKYDAYSVMDTVLMGHEALWNNMKEREALYSKAEMTEEDGNRAAELEEKFAEMNGWEAESDAAQLLQNLGVKEDAHHKQMTALSNNEKVRVMLSRMMLSGANFVVSPYFDPETVKMCNRYRVAVMPGIMTVKEAVAAMEAGADILKVFPGDVFGPKIILSLIHI